MPASDDGPKCKSRHLLIMKKLHIKSKGSESLIKVYKYVQVQIKCDKITFPKPHFPSRQVTKKVAPKKKEKERTHRWLNARHVIMFMYKSQ